MAKPPSQISKPSARSPEKPAKPGKPVRAAFPKKNQPPTDAEFAASLPLAVGRKLDAVRTFLKKVKGVEESWHFYGPKAGWAYRYLRGDEAIATLVLHEGTPTAVVALDAETQAAIAWDDLSPAASQARKLAHGTPTLLWLDLPLDGTGAADLRKLVRAKVRS